MVGLSFWERESWIEYEAVIAGAGITGLSLACELLERAPNLRVLICDAGLLPLGASTRNAGFACTGPLTEALHDIEQMGEQAFVELFERRWKGLQKLRSRIGEQALEFEALGSFEILKQEREQLGDEIFTLNKLLEPVAKEVYSLTDNRFGFASKSVWKIIENRLDGQLHSGKAIRSLWGKAAILGVLILQGTQVKSYDSGQAEIRVELQSGERVLSVKTQRLFICTNAFSSTLLPQIKLEPGRGQVLVTKPLEQLPFQGTFSFDEGYYYFRNVGNRVLFGGGRNLDFEGENTTAFGANSRILNSLREHLSDWILPNMHWEEDMNWSGIMAFSPDKKPFIDEVEPGVFAAIRMNGMGVALASGAAEKLANQSGLI